MINTINKCPLCSKNIEITNADIETDNFNVKCETCGKFKIKKETVELEDGVKKYEYKKYILSGITRQRSDDGIETEITNSNIKQLIDSASIPGDLLEAIDRVLFYIQGKTSDYSDKVKILYDTDYPIAFSKNRNEFQFILMRLVEIGYLHIYEKVNFRITIEGWKYLVEKRKEKRDSSQAFVAMNFNSEFDSLYDEGMKKALEETGYKSIRVDREHHNEKIDDYIVAEIRKSGLLVADVTGNRSGVYFEAGFAMGLGIPVIWTCREDFIDEVHFDTRQYNHILWSTLEELKQKLIERIEATLPGRTS